MNSYIQCLLLFVFFTLTFATAAAGLDPDSVLLNMQMLSKERRSGELITRFQEEDLPSWKDREKAAKAAGLRAKAHVALRNGIEAEKDFNFVLECTPNSAENLLELGSLYEGLLNKPLFAIKAYARAFAVAGKSLGWIPISATLHEASILLRQKEAAKARDVWDRYSDSDVAQMAPVWGDKMRSLKEEILDQLTADLLVLAEKGTSEYQIVLPGEYPSTGIAADMQQVARLLQTAFKANGVDMEVVVESARNEQKPSIYLGATRFALSHGVSCQGWSYVHKTVGRDLIIAGCDETAPGREAEGRKGAGFDRIGTAKAVVDFLQSYARTRFLFPEQGGFAPLSQVSKVDLLHTPTIEYLPAPRIAIPPMLDVKKTPPLEFDITWPPTVSFYHLAQNRFPAVDSIFGGHTWHRAIPSDQVAFESTPERFALLGGKRVRTGSEAQVQFCISHPDFQELLYQDLAKHFALGFQNVDLGQPDGFRGCECDACLKLFKTGSDWSEKIWILHRNLAERAYRAFPDRTVTLSVYAITETLPKTFNTFPPNVRLGMSGTRDSELAAWRNFGAPRGFSTYLYYWCPNMMPRYLPMRTPLYVEKAAERLMAAQVHSITRDGNGGIAFGLEGPTYYTMGRMFDGAGSHTAKDLVVEYVTAAFGKASPAMMSFYDQLYNSLEVYARYLATREDGWKFVDMYGRGHKHLSTPESIIAFLFPMELVQGMEKQLSAAEGADPAAKVQTRLALVRAEFEYLKGVVSAVHLYNAYQILADTASLDRLLNEIDQRRSAVDALINRTKTPSAWPVTLFPPNGHNADMLKLRYDGYQEPYKNSFFNWDTAAKRKAPLPGAKRMVAGLAQTSVALDTSQWDNLPSESFDTTTVRALYDEANIYLRFESQIPPKSTPEAAEKERFEVWLTPVTNLKISFKFGAGLRPDSRTQAARGMLEDMMNLNHDKFDTLWKAQWSHESRLDEATGRITVMMSIPRRIVLSAAETENPRWFVNFQRSNSAGTHAWSVSAGSTGMEDPRRSGELSLGGADPRTPRHPLKELREKSYRDTFAFPTEWKEQIASGRPITLTGWKFRPDPAEMGVREEWFKLTNQTDPGWAPMEVPSFWEETESIGKFLGDGWYLVTFPVPPPISPGSRLRLLFAGVDEQAWIYLNGKQVGEHSERSERKAYTALYEEPFIVDVPAEQLKTSGENVLCIRVHNQVGAGGIWRPVHAILPRADRQPLR